MGVDCYALRIRISRRRRDDFCFMLGYGLYLISGAVQWQIALLWGDRTDYSALLFQPYNTVRIPYHVSHVHFDG